MNLREKIDQDFKDSFRAKDEKRVLTLRLLLASIKNREIEKRTKLSKGESTDNLEALSKLNDEEIISIISSEIKKRRDSAEQYQKGGRPELAEREEGEIKILSVYLPAQLSEDELQKIIKETIDEADVSSQKEMGKLMAVLMPKIKGRADGGLVSKIVQEMLKG